MLFHNHGQPFEPDQDLYIRRWAARFNLAPDDRVVVMTAAIEQTCSQLSAQFAQLQHTVDERQEQWTHSLALTNQTMRQALSLIHQQQTNQTALAETYAELTKSLLKFERGLALLDEKLADSAATSPDLTSDLTAIRTSLTTLNSNLATLSRNQTTLDTSLSELKASVRPRTLIPGSGWLSGG
jgi:chromosome segregation ATPase